MKKTQGVHDLIREVLATIPRPHSEDIIDEVCLAITSQKKWQSQYDLLSSQLRDWVVNNWIGKYVAFELGRQKGAIAIATNSLTKYYSKLPSR